MKKKRIFVNVRNFEKGASFECLPLLVWKCKFFFRGVQRLKEDGYILRSSRFLLTWKGQGNFKEFYKRIIDLGYAFIYLVTFYH